MISSTNKFKVQNIIFKSDCFAIATGHWDGNKDLLRVACRWYEDEGIGYPQTFGKPQWMMLPEDTRVDIHDALSLAKSSVNLSFG